MARTKLPVAVALGSNLGDRESELRTALDLLDATQGVELLAVSSLYESAPWGDADQGPFLNAVALGNGTLEPEALLARLQGIESWRGKEVVRKWGPRSVDLDLLFVGKEARAEAGLTLPHPQIAERPFVYLPLSEALTAVGVATKSHPMPGPAGRQIEEQTRRLPPAERFPSKSAPLEERDLELPSIEATVGLGEQLARLFAAGGTLALTGPLGAGKSELARAVMRALGVAGPIPSPSYTLCREYQLGELEIEHWDFYRLESVKDLESAGFESREQMGALTVVEWAEKFPGELPGGAIEVTLAVTGEHSRHAAMRRSGGLPLLLRALDLA